MVVIKRTLAEPVLQKCVALPVFWMRHLEKRRALFYEIVDWTPHDPSELAVGEADLAVPDID
jgi:hypothetical protein